ncbi:P-loop ATPase, Sll1717 family [Devosia marina]|uniref:Uncharacterized protein n=1 Tax=Devosia marina TaxID=2683198 RepID=A0A7X3FNB8_9HYPH|nr:hypothetical protein [Devosia marina]MVS97724.1 hypothetical protein [Devosia marina]
MKDQTAFVAYPSDGAVAEDVFTAVRQANALAIPVRYEPWPFNDVPGSPLTSPIVGKISNASFIVADITLLNLNVVYEIGYAIGRGKRAFLIRRRDDTTHRAISDRVGIFDTLGYFEYSDASELKDRLAAEIEPFALEHEASLDRRSPIYIVEPPNRDYAVGVLVSRLKKAGYGRYRSFTPDEDARLSATEAIRQVASSLGVVLPLDGREDGLVHNVRAMFVAGLADGMEKPKLLLAPSAYKVPLDLRDDAKKFGKVEDIVEIVADFCPLVAEYSSKYEPKVAVDKGLLVSLNVGDPRAENEMASLGRYYLETAQFGRAIRGEANLVVGRKGSGKTALFIRVRDEVRANRRNVVVDLKPEGYQLIKIKEDILSHLSQGAAQHLITVFWEYLVLLEVAYKILEKDRVSHRHNHEIYDLYRELEDTYQAGDFTAEGDFSERLSSLSAHIARDYETKGEVGGDKLSAAEITQLVHRHDLRKLRDIISRYMRKRGEIWVLFDNLDKGWSTQGVDVIDAIILRCLVDAGRKLERDMRRDGHIFHCIVFVRNDVYDHLMKNSPDYGKEIRVSTDWSDADMLREMLRLRLSDRVDAFDTMDFQTIWRHLFVSHFQGEETSTLLIGRALMRPRNLLKLFNHCRGFAINFRHSVVAEDHIEKGLKAYAQDLLQELDRELTDVKPVAQDLLYHFLDQPSELSRANLEDIMRQAAIPPEEYTEVVDYLLYYGVLGSKVGADEYYIHDVNYDLKVLKVRAEREADGGTYVINPAFWPALGIVEPQRQP